MLRFEQSHADEMIAHAREEYPNECCGILAGKDEQVLQAYRIANTAKSPVRYVMDPQEQLNAILDVERRGWQFLAFYHSHTHSSAYPSVTDVRMALQSGYLDEYYILVSLEDEVRPDIRAFHIDETGGIAEEQFQIP